MSLSNTTLSTLAAAPYFDDFDSSKRFHRILHRPKFPVQTRELNGVQSMLQNQVGQLGAGIFKEGAAVVGGNSVFANNVLAVQVVKDDAVSISNFFNSNTGIGAIIRGLTSTAEGRVTQVDRQASDTYSAIIVAPQTANPFVGDEVVSFIDSTSNSAIASMTLAPDPATKNAATFSVHSGTFFLRGHLIDVAQQTIILSAETNLVSARVGFVIEEEILDDSDDDSLLDPALGATNYAAPGAHRLRLTATLTSKALTGSTLVEQSSDENFIEIARIINGSPLMSPDRIEPSQVEETLARRTFDESGDYVTRPFRLLTKPHNPPISLPNATGTITGNTTSTTVIASSVTPAFVDELTTGDVVVVNGERKSVSSVTNSTAFVVNSAFSIAFSNTPFTIVSSGKMNIELEAGKAYVRGREFETLGTTIIEVDRPRTTRAVNNGDVGTFFGPYVYVTRANGALFAINTLERVDLHSVPFTGVNAAANTYASTKIGSARVRSFVYASGNGDANTVYKMHLVGAEFNSKTFSVNGAASHDNSLSLVATTPATNVVTLTHNATAASRSLLPTTNNAFVGAHVTLTGIDGSSLKYTVVASTFTVTGNLVTAAMTFDSNSYFDKINTTANVTVVFTDKSIRGITNANTKTKGASVSVESKLGNIETGNTVLVGASTPSLIFKFPQSWIVANSIVDETFDAIRYSSAVATSGANATHTFYQIQLPSNESFYPTPGATPFTHFTVSNSTGYFVPLVAGQSTVAISPANTVVISIPPSLVGTGAIDVYSTVSVDTATPRSKVLVYANTNVASVTITSQNVISDLVKGHVGINTVNTASPRIVGLGVPDVYALEKVYAIVTPGDASGSWVDVTSRYTLDNGQRSWAYDYASIVLKPGYSHYNAQQLVVMVDLFTSSANGYFTAESYIGSGLPDTYVDIPTFTNPVNGLTFSLRDRIDFRPMRTANTVTANVAANPYVSANAVFGSTLLPHPDSVFTADYDFYLPRIDKVVLTRNREFKVVQGEPDVRPVPPNDPENSMTLYTLQYGAYLPNTELVQVHTNDHRRYTMRDIGRLEKRIEHLEYYVSLSLLEDHTLNQPELDGNDIERFKNGILIDPFMSYAIANPSDVDYRASIDQRNRELRPAFSSYGFKINSYKSNSSSNVVKVGSGLDDVVMLAYTSNTFIAQPLASTTVNINPFNVASWRGQLELSPESDIWMNTITRPTVTINMFEENSSWAEGSSYGFGMVWNDWQDNWSGITTTTNKFEGEWYTTHVDGDPDPRAQYALEITEETIVSQTNTPWRTGQQIFANMSTVYTSKGDRVVDISISPYMRSANVALKATGLKPSANLFAFFDEKDVTNFVERANEIRVANSTVAAMFPVGTRVTSNVSGVATVAAIVNDTLFVVDARGQFQNATITNGANTANVASYVSWAGTFYNGINATSVTLDAGAFDVASAYVGNTIFITSGPGAGSKSTITAFNSGTHVATLDPAFPVTVGNTTTYSIGQLKTDGLPITASAGVGYSAPAALSIIPGNFVGMFRLPGTVQQNVANVMSVTTPSLVFNTGKRQLRLSDNATATYATTATEAAYTASGHTQQTENTLVGTRETTYTKGPLITQTGSPVTVSSSQGSSTWTQTLGIYVDPVAQTFLVDPARFSNGVFVTSVDLFFARVDPSRIPVTVQLRPTVNGYPSSDIYMAESTLPGTSGVNSFNVVPADTTPNPANTSHYTRFTFPRPVYLVGGQEYSIVVMSNSFEYELFVGEIGQTIIGDTKIISEQPYGGSFFKSQNARTWTAEQNQDLMFVLNSAIFTTSAGVASFQGGETINSSSVGYTASANGFDYDVVNIQTGHLDLPPTVNNSSHTIQLTELSSHTLGAFFDVRLNQNVIMPTRKVVDANTQAFVDFRATLQTDDPNVSPVYDLSRMSMIAVRNQIDNGGLYANGFVIESGGAGYANGTFVISVDGVTDNATVTATVANNIVSSIAVSPVGSGYTSTPVLSWSASASTNAVITYRGETSNKQNIVGEEKARYISRRVTLADGFDASDIKVYVSANRPAGTNIEAYYKVLATGDVERFEDKNWVLMTLKPTQSYVYASNDQSFREYEYTTAANTAAYVSNSTTYDRFHTFAIKIVMRSEDTAIVPRLRNLRAIALDE